MSMALGDSGEKNKWLIGAGVFFVCISLPTLHVSLFYA